MITLDHRARGWALRLRQLAVPLLVPLTVAGGLAWALQATPAGGGAAVAAVVNNDRPVTVDGELVPLGRQLAGVLVDGSDRQFRWVLTSESDARRGLTGGDYTAVVTVPPGFSERATSALSTNDASKAAQGVVEVDTARDSAVTEALVARRVVAAATSTLNAQVVRTYLDQVYLGFGTLRTEVGKASAGAGKLAAGTTAGVTGARKVATGAQRLGDGSAQLAGGASALAQGLTEARTTTKDLPAKVQELASGASQVADGNARLAGTVVPVANAALAGLDALPGLETTVDQLSGLSADCPRLLLANFCRRIDAARASAEGNSLTMHADRRGVRARIVELRDGVSALQTGSARVADGARQLSSAAPQLAAGLDQASAGARQLAAGAGQLHEGAGRLSHGASELADGLARLDDGATALSSGLAGALPQLPAFSPAERATLASAVATPTALAPARSSGTARLQASVALVVALWLGALVVSARRSARPAAAESTRGAVVLALASSRVAASLSAAIGGVLGLVMTLHLGLGPGRGVGLVLLAAMTGAVFGVVVHALIAVLGPSGLLVAPVVALLVVLASTSSAVPEIVHRITGLLPTDAAGTAFRAVTMGGGGLPAAVTALVAWAGVALAVHAWVLERSRTVSPRALRLEDAARGRRSRARL